MLLEIGFELFITKNFIKSKFCQSSLKYGFQKVSKVFIVFCQLIYHKWIEILPNNIHSACGSTMPKQNLKILK
ncbi:hypothetical protein, partial [uncultured Helicobacter sp.]|uniref:hypothetical protein n=1 Tax=uncultured Helicobacter sp. TaxID=175537 RepID=UPI0037508E06